MSRSLPADVAAKLYKSYVQPVWLYIALGCLARLTTRQRRFGYGTPSSCSFSVTPSFGMDHPEVGTAESTGPVCAPLAASDQRHELLTSSSPYSTGLSTCLYPFAYTRSSRSLRKLYQLLLPNAKSYRFIKSLFFHSALLWNTLPHSIQCPKSTKQFKSAIEIHWATFKYNPN